MITTLEGDRSLGAFWEQEFVNMALKAGKLVTSMQLNHTRSIVAYKNNNPIKILTLPDIVLWTFPGEYHEVKHKSPTRYGSFGLEKYRFDALIDFANETHQKVMYTIHDHSLNGGRDNKLNQIAHWFTANVVDLNNKWVRLSDGSSWVNGIKRDNIPICYWKKELWHPLIF